MTCLTHRRRQAHLTLAAAVSGLAVVTAMLYRFPPETYGFYPQCPFHALTGLLCPGCGATRALATLLHGNLKEAMPWNGLFVVLVPILLVYLAIEYVRAVSGRPQIQVPKPAIVAMLATAISFAVLRNLV